MSQTLRSVGFIFRGKVACVLHSQATLGSVRILTMFEYRPFSKYSHTLTSLQESLAH